MVQRKVPNQLGIQVDHVKSEKRLGNLKPIACQYQDGKNRGPDMKKKMKRSRSIKLSDIENLKPSPFMKTISQPGKPPPLNAPTTTASPQKQPVIKTTDGSPNYMKSTSSSEARRERPQVSSLNTPTSTGSKNLRRRNSSNSKLSPASSAKPRTLSRTSSLKLVRTLTKTPSFKPVRGTSKKCSRVALCTDINVQKATCSSTLKDSKFPAYLMLNPEGTEAEGTSVIKVCPYTYCSLNGHHHTPLPPLKCFLKARRRSLKAQKGTKFEVLSLHKAKPSGDGTKEINRGLLGFFYEEPQQKEADSADSVKLPTIQQPGIDFFIEVYAKNIGDGIKSSTIEDDTGMIDFAGELEQRNCKSSFYGGGEAADEQDNREQATNSHSNASPLLDTGLEENFEQHSDINSEDMVITEGFLEEQKIEDTDGYLPILPQEEASTGCFDSKSDNEEECHSSMEEDDNSSEATDMEWEEGQVSTAEVGTGVNRNKPDDDSNTNIEYLSEVKKLDLHHKPEITTSGDMLSNCTEEILADEVLQELFEEETSWGFLESTQVTGCLGCEQLSSSEDAFTDLTTTEETGKEAETDLINTATAPASTGEPIAESTAPGESIQEDGTVETNSQPGDVENDCTTDITGEALNDHQEGRSLPAAVATTWLQSQIVDSSLNSDERDKIEIGEDYNDVQRPRDMATNENLAISVPSLEQELPKSEAADVVGDQEQVVNAKFLFGIQISYSSKSFSEASQDDAGVTDGHNHIRMKACQLDEATEDSNLSGSLVDEGGPADSHNHLLDGQCESNDAIENQNSLEEYEDEANKYKIPTSMDSEQRSGSRVCKLSLPGNNAGGVEKKEAEDWTMSDTAQTSLKVNERSSLGAECIFPHIGSNSNQELPHICNNRKWTIRCKKPINNFEEQLEFNPREPNFLPIVPDPEAEKVDLRHQVMDDRKNAKEWMLDYALQRAVSKLAPARKRKVALLVEAFETVLPIPKYETHIKHTSTSFSHTRTVQACS